MSQSKQPISSLHLKDRAWLLNHMLRDDGGYINEELLSDLCDEGYEHLVRFYEALEVCPLPPIYDVKARKDGTSFYFDLDHGPDPEDHISVSTFSLAFAQ